MLKKLCSVAPYSLKHLHHPLFLNLGSRLRENRQVFSEVCIDTLFNIFQLAIFKNREQRFQVLYENFKLSENLKKKTQKVEKNYPMIKNKVKIFIHALLVKSL